MTREEARSHWLASGLSLDDIAEEDFRALRGAIDRALRTSGLIEGYRAPRPPRFVNGRFGRTVEIFCQSHYFDRREAVTFNRDGFIGFAGWADDRNVQPILEAFCAWVDALCATARTDRLRRSA